MKRIARLHLMAILLAGLAVVVGSCVHPTFRYVVQSRSMAPCLLPGDRIRVRRIADKSRVARWDVVLFVPPAGQRGVVFAMRIVALPGESVQIVSGRIAVNGRLLPMPSYMSKVQYTAPEYMPFGRSLFVVPSGHVFVLGDNSTLAKDSRAWGSVPLTNVVGQVDAIRRDSEVIVLP